MQRAHYSSGTDGLAKVMMKDRGLWARCETSWRILFIHRKRRYENVLCWTLSTSQPRLVLI